MGGCHRSIVGALSTITAALGRDRGIVICSRACRTRWAAGSAGSGIVAATAGRPAATAFALHVLVQRAAGCVLCHCNQVVMKSLPRSKECLLSILSVCL